MCGRARSRRRARARERECADSSDKPWLERLDFIKRLAAVVALRPDETSHKHPSGQIVRNMLAHACNSGRLEWYVNNIRHRHRLRHGLRTFVLSLPDSYSQATGPRR